MDSKETNFLTPILSAIAGLGTIAAALLPIFAPTRILEKIFVNPASLEYLSVVGFLAALLFLWFFASNYLFSIFPNNNRIETTRLKILLTFIILAFSVYAIKVLHTNNVLSLAVSEILQAIAYIGSLSILSAIIGMLFKETYDRYTWNGEAAHKVQDIREAIIDSGHVQVDLKIIAMGDHKYNNADPTDWMSSTDVFFETNGKTYEAIVKTKPKAVLRCVESAPVGQNDAAE